MFPELASNRVAGNIDQVRVKKKSNHPLFDPVMEWQKHPYQDDFYKQYLPGFTPGYLMNFMVGDQYDEFEKKNKGKEAQHFNYPL
jgi:hypothetical protein